MKRLLQSVGLQILIAAGVLLVAYLVLARSQPRPTPPTELRLVAVEWVERDLCLNPCELKVYHVTKYEWQERP